MSFYMSLFSRSFYKLKNNRKILSSFTNEEGSKEMEFREFVFDSAFRGLKSFIRKSTKLIEIDIDPNYFHAINKVDITKRDTFPQTTPITNYFKNDKIEYDATNYLINNGIRQFQANPKQIDQVFETVPIQNQLEIEKKIELEIKANMKQIAYEPELTPDEIEKIPFNFGKCALGTYLRKQIIKGYYDQFLQKTLKMSANFVKSFKEFCETVEYSNINHFRRVWRYKEFRSDMEYNKFVALTKITIEFLKKDVNHWIIKKPKREDYKQIYRICADFFLRWIEDVEGLKCSDFANFLCIFN